MATVLRIKEVTVRADELEKGDLVTLDGFGWELIGITHRPETVVLVCAFRRGAVEIERDRRVQVIRPCS